MLQEHLVSVLENNHFPNDNTVTPHPLMNTFRPLVKKQMHTFNVEGNILGCQEVVNIIYRFIKNGI